MSPARPFVRHPRESEEYYFAEGCHILETWNQDTDPAVSIARARVAPGATTRLHRLRGIAERYLVLAGRGLVEVEGLAPSAVGPGDLVYIPPGCHQRIANTGRSDLLFLAVCTPRFVPDAYVQMESEI